MAFVLCFALMLTSLAQSFVGGYQISKHRQSSFFMVAIAYTGAHETELVNTGLLHIREIQGDKTSEL